MATASFAIGTHFSTKRATVSGEAEEDDREEHVEEHVEMQHLAARIGLEAREELEQLGQRGREDHAAGDLEEQVAERDAPAAARGARVHDEREQAAAEVGAEHQAERHRHGDDLRGGERGGEQHHGEARQRDTAKAAPISMSSIGSPESVRRSRARPAPA
jgi:hypothetical protein